jgi:hypothetical protein
MTVHFLNYAAAGQPRAARDAAKHELASLVAKHGGAVVAAATPEVVGRLRV